MANIETVELAQLNFAEGAAPGTPSAASVIVYAKADGLLYSKDDAGAETLVSGGLGGSGGIDSGTSFPGSPADNDLFFRTDRGIMYYYRNSLTAWHSVELYRQTIPNTIAANTAVATTDLGRLSGPVGSGYAWYLERLEWTAYTITTQSGTQYWTLQLERFDGGTKTSIGSALSTQNLAADQYHGLSTTSVAGVQAATIEEFQVAATKVSTVGDLIVAPATLVYRLVG